MERQERAGSEQSRREATSRNQGNLSKVEGGRLLAGELEEALIEGALEQLVSQVVHKVLRRLLRSTLPALFLLPSIHFGHHSIAPQHSGTHPACHPKMPWDTVHDPDLFCGWVLTVAGAIRVHRAGLKRQLWMCVLSELPQPLVDSAQRLRSDEERDDATPRHCARATLRIRL